MTILRISFHHQIKRTRVSRFWSSPHSNSRCKKRVIRLWSFHTRIKTKVSCLISAPLRLINSTATYYSWRFRSNSLPQITALISINLPHTVAASICSRHSSVRRSLRRAIARCPNAIALIRNTVQWIPLQLPRKGRIKALSSGEVARSLARCLLSKAIVVTQSPLRSWSSIWPNRQFSMTTLRIMWTK